MASGAFEGLLIRQPNANSLDAGIFLAIVLATKTQQSGLLLILKVVCREISKQVVFGLMVLGLRSRGT